MARLDLGDDLVSQSELLEAPLGGNHQLRAPVGGVGPALDVAQILELVHQAADDLLVATG